MTDFDEEEDAVTMDQELKLITRTIIYHLGLDGHVVTEAQARNVAAHLMLVVPEFREIEIEKSRARRRRWLDAVVKPRVPRG